MSSATGTVVYDSFDPHFTKPVTMIVCAPRGSGKSVFMSDVMENNSEFFDDVFVFAGSEAVYNDYVDRLPPSRLKRGYSDENMQYVIDYAKRATAITELHCEERERPWQVALILDDLGYDKSIFRSKVHLEV